jgi:hypothetical protein
VDVPTESSNRKEVWWLGKLSRLCVVRGTVRTVPRPPRDSSFTAIKDKSCWSCCCCCCRLNVSNSCSCRIWVTKSIDGVVVEDVAPPPPPPPPPNELFVVVHDDNNDEVGCSTDSCKVSPLCLDNRCRDGKDDMDKRSVDRERLDVPSCCRS